MSNKPKPLEVVEDKKPTETTQAIQNEVFDGKTDTEVVNIWASRRGRMANRRRYFESLWRNGIHEFFKGIINESVNGSRPMYNSLYEQYDFSLFSRDGLRFNNLKYPMLHAITLRALASEMANLPKVNFIAVGSNDPTKTIAFKHLFNQVLYEMNADEEDFEILLSRKIFGTSVALQMTESFSVTVKDPEPTKANDGSLTYTKKTKKFKQCLYRHKDLRHVYLDEHCTKTNLSDCGYAQIDDYYSPAEFVQMFSQYPMDKVLKAAVPNMERDQGSIYYNWFDPKGVDFIRVSHSFDSIQDCYHIIANDILLNGVDNPIPRIAGKRGKQIPIALAVQYKIPNAPYGYGDSHVTTSFNHIKDIVRMMILEITQKTAKPLLAVDPLSSFDEQQFEWGSDFIRVSPSELREIPITPDLNALYDMDKLTDNDIIRTTGINISDTTSADSGETARKTVIRRESQLALVELGLKTLTNSFYKRLYTLLKDDVILHYKNQLQSGEVVKVMTKGIKIIPDGTGQKEIPITGFRYFDLKPENLDMDMELDLEIGNIATSKELDKALQQEALQSIIPLLQTGAFDPKGVAKWLQELNLMPETVLPKDEMASENMTPEQIAQKGIDPSMLPETEQMKLQQQAQQAQSGQPNPPANGSPVPGATPPAL